MDIIGGIAVHVIESPSNADRDQDLREGNALVEALRLHHIHVTLHDVRTSAAFNSSFVDIADWHLARTEDRDLVPAVHISAHGNQDVISLTSGEDVPWSHIDERLGKLRGVCGGLILAMSSCKGFFASKIALLENSSFDWMVGSTTEPDWSETLVGFSTLYHQLNRELLLKRPSRQCSSRRYTSSSGEQDTKRPRILGRPHVSEYRASDRSRRGHRHRRTARPPRRADGFHNWLSGKENRVSAIVRQHDRHHRLLGQPVVYWNQLGLPQVCARVVADFMHACRKDMNCPRKKTDSTERVGHPRRHHPHSTPHQPQQTRHLSARGIVQSLLFIIAATFTS